MAPRSGRTCPTLYLVAERPTVFYSRGLQAEVRDSFHNPFPVVGALQLFRNPCIRSVQEESTQHDVVVWKETCAQCFRNSQLLQTIIPRRLGRSMRMNINCTALYDGTVPVLTNCALDMRCLMYCTLGFGRPTSYWTVMMQLYTDDVRAWCGLKSSRFSRSLPCICCFVLPRDSCLARVSGLYSTRKQRKGWWNTTKGNTVYA